MPSNFEIAALDAEKKPKPVEAERVAEITVNKKYVSLWRQPTPGGLAMFQLRTSRSRGSEQAKGVDKFFSGLLLTPEEIVAEGRRNEAGDLYSDLVQQEKIVPVGMEWMVSLIEDGIVGQDFLVDMLKEAVEIHSSFPTSSPSDSSPSQKPTGPSSTARSRRAAPTPSS